MSSNTTHSFKTLSHYLYRFSLMYCLTFIILLNAKFLTLTSHLTYYMSLHDSWWFFVSYVVLIWRGLILSCYRRRHKKDTVHGLMYHAMQPCTNFHPTIIFIKAVYGSDSKKTNVPSYLLGVVSFCVCG